MTDKGEKPAEVGDPVWVVALGLCGLVKAVHVGGMLDIEYGHGRICAAPTNACLLLDRAPIGEHLWLRIPSWTGIA